MNCREVLEALRDERPLNGEAREHLGRCARCSAEESAWRVVRATLREPVGTPPFLHARIMATVRAEARAPEVLPRWYASFWPPRWVLPSLAAVLVVLGEGFGVQGLFRPLPDDMEVVWSEQEAILMAQNALPLRAVGPPSSAPSKPGESQGLLNFARSKEGPAPTPRDEAEYAPEPTVASTAPPPPPAAPSAQPSAGFDLALREERPSEAGGPSARRNTEEFSSDSAKQAPVKAESAEKGRADADLRTPAASGLAAAKPAPMPAGEGGTRAEKKDSVSGLPCRVLRGGEPVGTLSIAPSIAPGSGSSWTFEVLPEGGILLDPTAGLSPKDARILQSVLGGLGLPTGTYRLVRP